MARRPEGATVDLSAKTCLVEKAASRSAGTSLRAGGNMPIPRTAARRFQLVLIKPSHYGDDGYVIRWWRAVTPSNSLAAVYGIAADCAAREVLGGGIAIDIAAIDKPTCAWTSLRLSRNFAARAGSGW